MGCISLFSKALSSWRHYKIDGLGSLSEYANSCILMNLTLENYQYLSDHTVKLRALFLSSCRTDFVQNVHIGWVNF